MHIELTQAQRGVLEATARRGQPAYVRPKALALLSLADGYAVRQVAAIFRVSRQSVYAWARRWRREGAAGLVVHAGRGRPRRADPAQIERYLRRSPRQFGLGQTRWSLAALARVVPSLRGFTPAGVQRALERDGWRYKRGQPRLTSPDPAYAAKKGRWTRR
jgi:transposase